MGQMTNAKAINAVPVLDEVYAGTTRSGACGSISLNTGNATGFYTVRMDSSFLVPRVVPRGRSQMVKSFVW